MTQGTYTRPYVNQYPTLITYRDLIDRLMDFANASPNAPQVRAYRIAIDEAYREVVNATNWKYYMTEYSLFTPEPYGTGTVSYTQSNRTVTLTTGTFPSWAQYGHIRIGNTYYNIDSNPTNTTLILTIGNNPGQDIASGTTYQLYQSVFPLPADYRSQFAWNVPATPWAGRFINPSEWMALERRTAAGGNPQYWTIMSHPKFLGSMAICLWPHPVTAGTYGGIYQRKPRDLQVSGWATADTDFASASTVAVSATTVTGTSTNFQPNMVGSVIRFGTASTLPDGTVGLNPASEQRIITGWTDATHVTIDSALVGSYSGVKYTISDPIDMSSGMLNALIAGMKFHYTMNCPKEGVYISTFRKEFEIAVKQAKEQDANPMSGRNTEGVGGWLRTLDNTYDRVP